LSFESIPNVGIVESNRFQKLKPKPDPTISLLLVLRDLLKACNKFLLEKPKIINAKILSRDSNDNNYKESDCKESNCEESNCKEGDCKETTITYTINEIEDKLQDNKT